MAVSRTGRWVAVLAAASLACTPAEGNDDTRTSAPEAASSGVEAAGGQGAAPPAEPVARRPADGYAWVVFGADTVVAEVAVSAEERAEGLMYREDVPDGTGMLFVFPDAGVRSFWMQNTYVPLDIAYMDAGFTVVDIQQLEPLDTTSRPSKAPAMYALEVRQGWFEEKGVGVGATARVEFGVSPR